MASWLLNLVQLLWAFPRQAWRWIKKKAADRQVLVSTGGDVVAKVQEFLSRARPINVSIEQRPGETAARLKDLDQEWNALRPQLRAYTNGHHSTRIRDRIGPELIEALENLLMGLHYMSSKFTEASDKAAVTRSVMAQHARASQLADELLEELHRS
jgi:hypothetical protein